MIRILSINFVAQMSVKLLQIFYYYFRHLCLCVHISDFYMHKPIWTWANLLPKQKPKSQLCIWFVNLTPTVWFLFYCIFHCIFFSCRTSSLSSLLLALAVVLLLLVYCGNFLGFSTHTNALWSRTQILACEVNGLSYCLIRQKPPLGTQFHPLRAARLPPNWSLS